MAPKIISAILTFLINIAIGVAVLAGMIIAMNGYSESDATWGLGVYVLLALIAAATTSGGAVLMTGSLIKKHFAPLVSVLIATPVFSLLGFALYIVCSFIGVGVAEFVRVKH